MADTVNLVIELPAPVDGDVDATMRGRAPIIGTLLDVGPRFGEPWALVLVPDDPAAEPGVIAGSLDLLTFWNQKRGDD